MQIYQKKENHTGLPDNIKSGVESMSGISMDDVKVHYNSSKPAQMKALAYTQGTDIHVAPGQEQHIGHEAWHVVQQKQGRVAPTMQMKGININDDARLEREADVMGAKAMQFKQPKPIAQRMPESGTHNGFQVSPLKSVAQKMPESKTSGDFHVPPLKNVAQRKTTQAVVQRAGEPEDTDLFSAGKRILKRLFKKNPKFVYRADTRSPQQIADAGGFAAWNEQNLAAKLLEHMIGANVSAEEHQVNIRRDGERKTHLNTRFVSTASARAFTGTTALDTILTHNYAENVYLYRIIPRTGKYVNAMDYVDRKRFTGTDREKEVAKRARNAYKKQREYAHEGNIPYQDIAGYIVISDLFPQQGRDTPIRSEDEFHTLFTRSMRVMPQPTQ